jgi:alkanesulfonate monooxygenase SsuD/methylene tetrahydromethanopterin reductase-like flavin-dependent oxidoreductase (luciferase family)
VSLGVAFGWHCLAFEELLALVRRAEGLGYAAAYLDGDVSVIDRRGEGDVLDGWTLTVALLALTDRIQIGSIRLPHHWNAAKLAQAAATAERMFPGRLRLLASIGAQRADARFGLPFPPSVERVAWLDELLEAMRALWRGETVTRSGRFVQLEGARVRPLPPEGRIPIEVGARRPRLLGVVARHADRWDVNLPPIRHRVEEAAAALERACAAQGRDPAEIGRSLQLFARPGRDPEDPALRQEFLYWSPWYADLPEGELGEAIVAGSAASCKMRIEAIRRDLRIDLPVIDCGGLHHDAARQVIDALAPEKTLVDPDTSRT